MSTEDDLTRVSDLSSFSLQEILGRSDDGRSIFLLATINSPTPTSQVALLLVSSVAMSERTVDKILSSTTLKLDKHNDIYYSYVGLVSNADFIIDIVYPATEREIAKYRTQQKKIILETPLLYTTITNPYIKQIPASQLGWVYNILEGRAEQEDIIYKDPHHLNGFVLMPDFKWNRVDVSAL